ncbi:hypothetical protein CHH69_12775 [Terribacillus saccharophilus]|uniref:hypothetical protein n=1 Tax=Terribacillus saccharophilus TaxID=361277 RepID=UPI000BA5AD8F|nr:hypothetical protein [Terribacillus saccharophilus]PAF35026.1 hypothetical protein CHH69_12775 [Terribacillus saccharophilus]
MKKLLIANILILISFIYLLLSVTKDTIYLNEFSMNVDNPVQLGINYIDINAQFAEGLTGIYTIWMTPAYILIVFAIVLILLSFKKKKKNHKG